MAAVAILNCHKKLKICKLVVAIVTNFGPIETLLNQTELQQLQPLIDYQDKKPQLYPKYYLP